MISYIGANKPHRQRKVVSRSTKRSVVQSTYNLSRGWMRRHELSCEGLLGRVALATMARSIEGTQTNNGFQLLAPYVFALGNKSGSFCEAVNCEQSEQERKFPFAI